MRSGRRTAPGPVSGWAGGGHGQAPRDNRLATGVRGWFDARTQKLMGLVRVQVWDATATKRQEVEMPDDAPVNRILAVLLDKMNFPQYAPDGQPLSYKFHHKASGKQLLDSQSLKDVGVRDGDVLRLQPEITAGRTRASRL